MSDEQTGVVGTPDEKMKIIRADEVVSVLGQISQCLANWQATLTEVKAYVDGNIDNINKDNDTNGQ
jgi:hypothetical protein